MVDFICLLAAMAANLAARVGEGGATPLVEETKSGEEEEEADIREDREGE